MKQKSWVNKRRIITALFSVSALAAIAACGSSTAPSANGASGNGSFAGQTLTVLDKAPAGAAAKPTEEYYNDLAALFHKETGATLQWQYYNTPAQEVSTVETSSVSGSGPDVIAYGNQFVGTLIATGQFPYITQQEWAELGGRNSFIQSNLDDSGNSPTQDIGVPSETNPFVLAYNTADFKKAGIASPPTTWNQFVADAQQIQKAIPGVSGVGIDPQDDYDIWKSVYYLDRELGGANWVGSDGKTINLDTPQMQQAVSFYFSLDYRFHIVPPQSLTWNAGDMDSAFTSGKVAMMIIAAYQPSLADGTPLQGHLGYALLPTVPYGDTSMPAGGVPIESETTGEHWAVPAYASSERALAFKFEALSLTPQIQLDQFKLLGWIPVNQAGIKAVEAYTSQADPFIKAAIAAYPAPNQPVWNYIETGSLTALHNIASNLATSNGKWSQANANSQLAQLQAAVVAKS
ncbi:MAG TPA: extracellular solute-binding protein [Trebonia sp.]|jgi:multiple sugar transport system substrate-binding protein|nr:extracellular solute-binding protein [Trebonia sp.]